MITLEPKVAVAKFESGDNLAIPILHVMKYLSLTAEQILPYLRSGQLEACSLPNGEIVVMTDELLEFLEMHPNVGKRPKS